MNNDIGYVVTAAPGSAQHFLCECRSTPGLTLVQNLEDNRFLCRFLPGTQTLFAQHRFPASFSHQPPNPESLSLVSDLLIENLNFDSLKGRAHTVQVTASWDLSWGGPELQKHLSDRGVLAEASQAPEAALSVYLHNWCDTYTLFAGISSLPDNLSPWTGGVCPLESDNPAEKTFLEAQECFQLSFAQPGRALDLGAAPGGWSRLLAEHGYQVDAVDPQALDSNLGTNSGITHHGMTAEEFLKSATPGYDLIVNDMDVGSGQALELLSQARPLLNGGGLVLTTLKLRKGRTLLNEARKAVAVLGQTYRVQAARQLSTNRSEITALLA